MPATPSPDPSNSRAKEESAWGPQKLGSQMRPEDYRGLFESNLYKNYVKGNIIEPLPGQVEELQKKVLSLVTSDLRTRSLTG